MGSVINACCWGQFGSRCCNVISLVGFIYFALNFLIFPRQKNFYQFHMKNPDDTRWSFLICSILYLTFFVVTFMRIQALNKSKQSQKKNTESIHENPKFLNINKGDSSIRQMSMKE